MTCLFGKPTIGLSGYNLMRDNPQQRSYSSFRNIYLNVLQAKMALSGDRLLEDKLYLTSLACGIEEKPGLF